MVKNIKSKTGFRSFVFQNHMKQNHHKNGKTSLEQSYLQISNYELSILYNVDKIFIKWIIRNNIISTKCCLVSFPTT